MGIEESKVGLAQNNFTSIISSPQATKNHKIHPNNCNTVVLTTLPSNLLIINLNFIYIYIYSNLLIINLNYIYICSNLLFINVGYRNLNEITAPRVIPMAEEGTLSDNKTMSVAHY